MGKRQSRPWIASDELWSLIEPLLPKPGPRLVEGRPLRPSPRALVALLYLRKHDTLTQIAAGFRISVGTAHAYGHAVIDLLARRAPGLTRALREADAEYVLIDGTLTECDRVGDGRTDYSGKHRRHGVNLRSSPTRAARSGGSPALFRAALTT